MKNAEVAELGDAMALGAIESNLVGVQISPSAHILLKRIFNFDKHRI